MTRLSNRTGVMLLLLITLVVMFIPWLGDTLFNTKGEPREALVAVSMLNSGNYILPESYGADIPYKPPMLAWLIAGATHIAGGPVSEAASRLPSVIAAILMLLGVYLFYSRRVGVGMAAVTTVVTFTSVEVYRAVTACRVDMVLTSCIVLAILAMVSAGERRGDRPSLSWIGILLMSGAVLTKGPVGMLLPCLVTGIYMLMCRYRFWPVFGMMALSGFLSLLLPALWYYAAWTQGGERFLHLALEENFGRFMGTMTYDSHLNPWWYNIVTLVAGMAPWTLLALMSLFALRRLAPGGYLPAGGPRAIWRRITSLPRPTLLALSAVIIIFIFYCIPASKRSVYLLPMYPFLAYFVTMLTRRLVAVRSRIIPVYTTIIASIGLVTAWAVWGFHMVDAAGSVTGLKGASLDLVQGLYNAHFGIADWAVIVLCIITAAVTLCLVARRGMRLQAAGCLATTVAIYLMLGATVLPRTLNPKSDIVIARAIERVDPSVSRTYTFNSVKMMRFFSTAFYLGDRLRMFAPEEGSSQSVKGVETPSLPAEGYLAVGQIDLPLWEERYGSMYEITDTVFKGTRRSGDSRQIPLLLHFRRLPQFQ